MTELDSFRKYMLDDYQDTLDRLSSTLTPEELLNRLWRWRMQAIKIISEELSEEEKLNAKQRNLSHEFYADNKVLSRYFETFVRCHIKIYVKQCNKCFSDTILSNIRNINLYLKGKKP